MSYSSATLNHKRFGCRGANKTAQFACEQNCTFSWEGLPTQATAISWHSSLAGYGSAGAQPERPTAWWLSSQPRPVVALAATGFLFGVGAQSPVPSDKLRGFGGRAPKPLLLSWPDEKRNVQLAHRLAPPLIRHVLEQWRTGKLSAAQATEALKVSRRRLYQLRTDYLAAFAHGRHGQWLPRPSGGNHAAAWPQEVTALLRKRLSSQPPASYSFAASEALRVCGFKLDRAAVRRFARLNGLAHAGGVARPKAAVCRWQRSRIGELWQLDATPHRWFAEPVAALPRLNRLDDCSRLLVGSKIYQREILPAYFDFLPAAFLEHGLPLELYVDYHSFFFTAVPEAVTQLGWALRFYGVSLRYAPTPQAKGKVEREHQFWQNRLPAYFASEKIGELTAANQHITALRMHHNQQEIHRELGRTPQAAWSAALREKRSVLRSVPRCAWWPYVWSQRTTLRVGSDGRVPIGSERMRVEVACGSWVVLCQHPSGHYSVLRSQPEAKTRPQLLFTNRPK